MIYSLIKFFCFLLILINKTIILDANKAIEIDKDYVKAYYRRASGNLLLGNYDQAIEDLEFLQSKFPNEESIKDKLSKAKVERKKKRFLEILASDRPDGT